MRVDENIFNPALNEWILFLLQNHTRTKYNISLRLEPTGYLLFSFVLLVESGVKKPTSRMMSKKFSIDNSVTSNISRTKITNTNKIIS